MNNAELDRVRVLMDQFHRDRLMRGYAEMSRIHVAWGLDYFLEFLKTRDESGLTGVTADTLHKYQMHLFTLVGKRNRPLSLGSQMHSLVSVRSFFQWLTKRGHLLADPSKAVALPKQKDPLPRGVMTQREVEKILSLPDVDRPLGLRDRAMLELLYSSGVRSSELRGLKVLDVNTADREVRIRSGKGGRDRVVPLGEVAGKYIDLYLQESRPKILRWKEDPGYLFLGRLGRKLDAASLNQDIIQRYARRAGIKTHVTTHGFRHTCATHLLKGRANIRHIQTLLGHKSLVSTQVYTRVEVGDLKRELKRCHPREIAR